MFRDKGTRLKLFRVLASGASPSTDSEIARQIGVVPETIYHITRGLRRRGMVRFVLTEKGRTELSRLLANAQAMNESKEEE